MKLEKITLRRTCSFYISNFHLSTLLLPYITNKVKNNTLIKTFFEEGIDENIRKVVKRINIEEYIKKEILKINWNKTEIINCSKVLNNINLENMDINIIVGGSKDYIENVNSYIKEYIESFNVKGMKYQINLTINNCYPVKEVLNLKEVLDNHDLLLNTSGEAKIDSVYEDYRKVSSI